MYGEHADSPLDIHMNNSSYVHMFRHRSLGQLTGRLAGAALKAYARRPTRPVDAVETQRKQLISLVDRAKETSFGVDHYFGEVRSVGEFRERVPVRNYEQMWGDYWQAGFPTLEDVSWPGSIGYFARSSGTTTGESKFIPVSRQMVRANNAAGMQVVIEHLRNRPKSTVAEGRTFLFGGSPNLTELAPGVFAGELSGIAARETPSWAGRGRYYPPEDLASLLDWERKVELLAQDCVGRDIRSISGVPTWLQILFDRVFDLHGVEDERLAALFPDLELLTHGGVNFAPYQERFERLLEGGRAELREVYAASEGFIAVADRGPGEGMRLLLGNGVFYEFVEVDKIGDADAQRHWINDVKLDTDYAVIVTTCAGLWAYALGDVIRFVDLDPPRLLVVGRVSQSLSEFGEHITGSELELAVAKAAAASMVDVVDFAVAPIHHNPGDGEGAGRHRFLVEISTAGALERDRIGAALDESLQAQNADYRAKRRNAIVLGEPDIVTAQPDTFRAWMTSKGQLGGQHKVQRVVDEATLNAMTEPER